MEELQRYADQMNSWFARGLPKGKIAQTLPLSHAAEAHQLYEMGSVFGKRVLVPD
jgi:NADPH:quinone reductase-like Zn-dependent oxidoreductase